jgi:4-hydroxyphenylacetate 3-monooxygenase
MGAEGEQHGEYFVPNRHLVYTAQVLTQAMSPQVINTLRELSGSNLITLPSSIEDFADETTRDWSLQAQLSPTMSAEEKVKFFKFAWDAVGAEFASRHTQYEMFYAGAQFTTRGNSCRTYDWQGSKAMVERILDSYDLTEEVNSRKAAAKAAE